MSLGKTALGGVVTVLILGAAAIYVLETYVLMGTIIYQARIVPSDLNVAPTATVPVREGGHTLVVFVKSHLDSPYTVTILSPSGEELASDHADGTHRISAEAAEAGNYGVRIGPETVTGGLAAEIQVFLDDKRFLAGCF